MWIITNWRILRNGNTRPPYCLLRNLSAEHGTTGWFKIGKGVQQVCILSPCLFNLYIEYITWHARLDEAQCGIKIAERNINNVQICRWHYLNGRKWKGTKNLFMKVKEENEKDGLKLNIQKTKIMASSPITSWQIDGETMETVTDIISWAPKSLWMVTAVMKLKDTCSLEGKLWQT